MPRTIKITVLTGGVLCATTAASITASVAAPASAASWPPTLPALARQVATARLAIVTHGLGATARPARAIDLVAVTVTAHQAHEAHEAHEAHLAHLALLARRAAQARAAAATLAAQPARQAAPPGSGAGDGPGASAPVSQLASTTFGSARDIARQLLDAAGQGGQFSCLDSLWERESGWGVDASNPGSGAYGIPQALPGSKMASAGQDWRSDPATQIRWGLSYIDGVYGSPCAAWAHEESVGWY